MTNNSEISIDDLIKRIYKSYVEIKVGEFREIDRDILLSDIGQLYTSIKNLYPSQQVPEIEYDLSHKNQEIQSTESKNETESTSSEQPITNIENIKNGSTETEVKFESAETHHESDSEHKTLIDLSIFDDAEQLEIVVSEELNLIDKKSDNTNSPILKSFQTELKTSEQKIQNLQDIPKIIKKVPEQNTQNEIETKIESKQELEKEKNDQKSTLETDKKSKSDIMDFLHHENKKTTRDIYSFLDLNTRIGLIELFFKGNSLELTECLVRLNKLDTKEACLKVIEKYASKFNVAETEDIYKQFVGLVDRKLEYQ